MSKQLCDVCAGFGCANCFGTGTVAWLTTTVRPKEDDGKVDVPDTSPMVELKPYVRCMGCGHCGNINEFVSHIRILSIPLANVIQRLLLLVLCRHRDGNTARTAARN